MSKMLKKIFLVSLLSLVLLSNGSFVSADTLSNLNQQSTALQQKKKQTEAEKLQQQQQAAAVQQQLGVVNSQIGDTTSALASTSGQINKTNAKIADLESQIAVKENELAKEQDKMGAIAASWYMEGQSGLLEAVIGANSLSQVIDNQEYYDSIRQQIVAEIENTNKLKNDLAAEKASQNQQLSQLTDLQKSQTEQMNYLEGRKVMKNRLLNDAQSAIADLTTEAQNLTKQIADLQARIDQIKAASVGAAGDVVSTGATSWYYQQGYDGSQPWSNYKMGYYATIGRYGCLLTSLTMIADFYGAHYNPQTAAQNSSFVHTWGSNDGAMISTSIVDDGGSQAVNWGVIDDELANGHPVVVGVGLGVDMGNSYGVSHFVVVTSKIGTGKYAMQDPLGPGRGYKLSQVKAMRIVRP